MPKMPSFMKRFRREHVNGSQTLLRSVLNKFHITLLVNWERKSAKKLVLVRREFLGEFANTLTADYQYSR